ncbi:ribonuclease H-like domain-containing protein, partial [Tanacetum coccineum]
ERKNRTLIEAARTMLADSKLSTTFWAEIVNTACYEQNRVLVTKPHNTEFKPSSDGEKKVDGDPSKEDQSNDQENDGNVNSTNNVNAVSLTVNAVGIEVNIVGAKTSIELPDDLNMSELENIVYSDDDEDVGAEADMNNLDVFMPISPIPTTRIHKDHL